MGNIFSDNPVFAIGTLLGLFGILASHRLLIYRDRKKRFDDSASEFRRVFNQALIDVHGDIFLFRSSPHDDRINAQRVAYLNFRHHLRGASRDQYDKAWEQYTYHYEHMGKLTIFTRVSSNDLENDIKRLLAFTEYRLLWNVSFYWNNFWWKFRLKVFGPDKETKELIEKISKHYEPPKK